MASSTYDVASAIAVKAAWQPDPQCPPHLVVELTNAVQLLPPSCFVPPRSGEQFASATEATQRLNGYALTQGFAVVRTGGSEKGDSRRGGYLKFACIHHGTATRNYRELEDHVEWNEEGEIVSDRKQENTSVMKRSCLVRYFLAHKAVPRGGSVKYWVLKVPDAQHSHKLAIFPLRYSLYRKETIAHLAAVELAITHRKAFLTYSESVRVLDQQGLSLTKLEYYNLRRQPFKNTLQGFEALIVALEDAGFIYRCLIRQEIDATDQPIAQNCEQVWFTLPVQIEFARRFIADFTCFIDGTFSTNALNLVLVVIYGVTNTGTTFPACLSFCRSESKVSFDFIFEAMKDFIFTRTTALPEIRDADEAETPGKDIRPNEDITLLKYDIPPPRVIISDQSKGLIASLPTSLPHVTLQLCDWHAVQNIMKRLANKKYTGDERDLIRRYVWAWVKAPTVTQAQTAQDELFSLLQQGEVAYITENWLPKKEQVLHCYTDNHPNLGANSNQRSEGSHPSIKQILNHQLSIQDATSRLGETLASDFRKLTRDEVMEAETISRLLDQTAFANTMDYVSRFALDLVSTEWENTKIAVDSGVLGYNDYASPDCTCKLIVRWGLPCRHYLLLSYLQGTPLAKSLFHQRWWLNGPPIRYSNWKPFERTLPLSPSRSGSTLPPPPSVRNALTNMTLQSLTVRDTLQGVAQAQYDQAIFRANRSLINEAHLLQQWQSVPTEQITAVPKRGFLKPSKGTHGKTTARALTGTEIAEKQADQEEIAAKRAAKAATVVATTAQSVAPARTAELLNEDPTELEVVPDTPPRAPPQAPPQALPQAPPSPEIGLPASTAPPAMEGNRAKRARASTGYYSALQAGDSQDARDKRKRR